VLLAAALGLALAVRATSGLVVPGFVVLEALALRRGERRVRDLLEAVAIGIVVVPVAIAAAYGFDRRAFASYLEALIFQLDHNRRGHLTYLLGQTSRHGWPYYFAVALAVKSTPGFLLGLAAAAWALVRSREGSPDVRLHWWLPAGIAFTALSLGRIQIGERYLLPVHAFAILLVASATSRLLGSRAGRGVLALVLAGHVVPAVAVAPRGYLTYFNAVAGGPDRGHRVLLDSNLDWGQDLPRLAAWMRRERVERIALAYDGADDPGRLGIARDDLPGRNHYATDVPERPLRGTVVVSPSLVFGLVPRDAARYAPLRARPPDARAGVFLVYRFQP
jgi:hypothetical protein